VLVIAVCCNHDCLEKQCGLTFRDENFRIKLKTKEAQITTVKQSAPLPAWSGPEGSGKLRFPDFMTTAQDGGKVVSPTHRPPLPPGNTPGTHFC
jgi:hypothetical protein